MSRFIRLTLIQVNVCMRFCHGIRALSVRIEYCHFVRVFFLFFSFFYGLKVFGSQAKKTKKNYLFYKTEWNAKPKSLRIVEWQKKITNTAFWLTKVRIEEKSKKKRTNELWNKKSWGETKNFTETASLFAMIAVSQWEMSFIIILALTTWIFLFLTLSTFQLFPSILIYVQLNKSK